MFPQYSSNMSLVNQQDVRGLLGAALPQGLRNDMMNIPSQALQLGGQAAVPYLAGMVKPETMNAPQAMQQPEAMQKPEAMMPPEQGAAMDKMAAYRMMAGALQGMAPRQQMPSGNTAQIIRDNNQFRFAGTPQQQMANALRRR